MMNASLNIRSKTSSYVFFDVDDTLISVKSMLSFQDYWYEIFADDPGKGAYYADLQRHRSNNLPWEESHRLYYQYFSGRRVADVEAYGSAWFHHMEKNNPNLFHSNPLAELKQHQRQGRGVVFVSGSFPSLLNPIARLLGVSHILSTSMEVVDGLFTGKIFEPQTIGIGKAEAIHNFLASSGALAEDCYAYADDISDLPMLQAVGVSTVIRGGRELEQYADKNGWRVMSPN